MEIRAPPEAAPGRTSITLPSTLLPLRIFEPPGSGTSCAISPRMVSPGFTLPGEIVVRRTTGRIVPGGISECAADGFRPAGDGLFACPLPFGAIATHTNKAKQEKTVPGALEHFVLSDIGTSFGNANAGGGRSGF
jgi:hypothetical protein